MAEVTIRYWAAAKEAAGRPEDSIEAETLAEALALIVSMHSADARFAAVLGRSSILVDGRQARCRPDDPVVLPVKVVVEILPPFAGG
jgi:molybdopterin synthase sulfur carrier subunit